MKTYFKLRKYFFLSLALILCAGLVQPTLAAPQGVIQDMIDSALDGSTVIIPAGSYHETLLVDKNLTLKGTSADTTVLRPAGENQRVISVTAGHNLHVEDLRITEGEVEEGPGGGIYLAGGSLNLDHVQIDHNQAAYGGGVFQSGTNWTVTISNSAIENNLASITGGGVYTSGSATLINTQLYENTAAMHGGGLHVNSGSASLIGGSVSANHASDGNGGGVNVNDDLTVSGTHFQGNIAGNSGGAISQWNTGKLVSISEADLSNNSARNHGGGAFINSYLTVSDTIFSANTVDSGSTGNTYGGGMYAGGGLDGNHLTFNLNSTKCTSCNITSGGGLYINQPSTGAASITHSSFDSNLAWFGSGISSETTVKLTLANTNFINNGSLAHGASSGYGGGVFAYWLHGDQLLFQNNQVLNNGGGLEANSIVLTHTRFINNYASGSGGGAYVSTDFNGSNLLFAENSALFGAAVYLRSGAITTLYNATIARPTQAAGPAAELEANATLNLYNSIVNNYTNAIKLNSATLTEDYNLFYNNTTDVAQSGICTVNSGGHTTGKLPPGFIDPAAGNYHLNSNSKAIGAGFNFGLTDDLDGRPRLAGRNDTGAYQFWASIYLPLISR